MRRRIAVFEAKTGTRKSVNAVLVTPFGMERNRYGGLYANVVTFDDLFVQER